MLFLNQVTILLISNQLIRAVKLIRPILICNKYMKVTKGAGEDHSEDGKTT